MSPKENLSVSFSVSPPEKGKMPWYRAYYPLLLIFVYLLLVVFAQNIERWDWQKIMTDFMGGFFVTFSFFKLLDLRGFAESYRHYDILAKRFRFYAFAYPFIELALGIGYLFPFGLWWINLATLVVMSVSIIGVAQSLLGKKKIQCACLGSIFKLPMSSVTLVEDGLMLFMAFVMLFFK